MGHSQPSFIETIRHLRHLHLSKPAGILIYIVKQYETSSQNSLVTYLPEAIKVGITLGQMVKEVMYLLSCTSTMTDQMSYNLKVMMLS